MICEQHVAADKVCANEAAAAFVWPGAEVKAICAQHLAWARRLAESFGFVLVELPVGVREHMLAEDAANRLEAPNT